MTRAATFKQADLSRAIKAVEDGGKSVAAVDIRRDGTIRVLIGEPIRAGDLTQDGGDEWDRLIANA
ncbi:MAG: hypothetical protein WAW13_00535 [Minisyncoccia bacterium]